LKSSEQEVSETQRTHVPPEELNKFKTKLENFVNQIEEDTTLNL